MRFYPTFSVSLIFLATALAMAQTPEAPMTPPAADVKLNTEASRSHATFGVGCFWCGEAVFQRLEGVTAVQSGYIGGQTKNPTYKDVCRGDTGHAEVIQVTYDPKMLNFNELLDIFWQAHDPTTLNRQGGDEGTQYRSAIFYHDEEQKVQAEASLKAWGESGKFKSPIVTEITSATEFYPAEDYHNDYFNRNKNAPYCRFVIAPKLKKLGMK